MAGTKACHNLRCSCQDQAGIILASRAELAGLPGRAACRRWTIVIRAPCPSCGVCIGFWARRLLLGLISLSEPAHLMQGSVYALSGCPDLQQGSHGPQ